MTSNEVKREGGERERELSKPANTSGGSTSIRPLNAKGNLAREF